MDDLTLLRLAGFLAAVTERELEVLRLVARGLSNREIADQPVLAEPTVKTHVSHALNEAGPCAIARRRLALADEVGLVRPGDPGHLNPRRTSTDIHAGRLVRAAPTCISASGILVVTAVLAPLALTALAVGVLYGLPSAGAVAVLAVCGAATVAFYVAVGLTVAPVVPGQPAVAAAGFGVFVLVPLIGSLVGPLALLLPTSIVPWSIGLAVGRTSGSRRRSRGRWSRVPSSSVPSGGCDASGSSRTGRGATRVGPTPGDPRTPGPAGHPPAGRGCAVVSGCRRPRERIGRASRAGPARRRSWRPSSRACSRSRSSRRARAARLHPTADHRW